MNLKNIFYKHKIQRTFSINKIFWENKQKMYVNFFLEKKSVKKIWRKVSWKNVVKILYKENFWEKFL